MKIAGMIHDGNAMYISAFRVGAVALVLDKRTDELSVGTVAEIVTMGFGTGYFLKSKDVLCGKYDATAEYDYGFDHIAFVGVNFLDECEDRKILRSFYDYMDWGDDYFGKDGDFAGIIVPDKKFDEREQERSRHMMHREIKSRMYAERQMRKRKGEKCHA